MAQAPYNPNELMICTASRLMEDNSTVFIGTGIPMLAGALAQKMHAPNLSASSSLEEQALYWKNYL